MLDLIDYFINNKNIILLHIKNEKFIFPKMFFTHITDIQDEHFYDKIKDTDNIFKYYFSRNDLKVFNIVRINEDYNFKSDHDYENLYLFFSTEHEVFVNNKRKSSDHFVSHSMDEIFIRNGDFLKISILRKDIFSFEDLVIPHFEKNLFDKDKIKNFSFKEVIFNTLKKNVKILF